MNSFLNRRQFIKDTALVSLASGAAMASLAPVQAATQPQRKMTMNLVCGAIDVSANQREAVELAARHGFESVEAQGGFLASLSEEKLAELKGEMKAKGIVFGAAGLPVEFRQDEARFAEGMKGLPRLVAGLRRAGVDRVSTWLMPCHDTLTYLKNLHQHARRLRETANVLKDHGARLGLEYVGPQTSLVGRRYPFIHTMAEMKDLIAEIGAGNVGFLLDSWHWWHAGETAADILSLKAEQVVAVDLNDAPAGIPKNQQADGRRELPCATGVIDVGSFLRALNQIGYDGPVRAEPFNKALNDMPNEEACAATIKALKRAFALLEA
jgi:sugar phosphate isomerase/epimerase